MESDAPRPQPLKRPEAYADYKGPIEDPRQNDTLVVTLTFGPNDDFTIRVKRRDFDIRPGVGLYFKDRVVTNIYPFEKILAIRIEEVTNA